MQKFHNQQPFEVAMRQFIFLPAAVLNIFPYLSLADGLFARGLFIA
jgi:hypothetical protein